MFMELNPKKEMPAVYRVLRIVAIVLSVLIAILFVLYAAWFVFSGPVETLMDDLAAEDIFMVALIATAIVSYMCAWYHPLSASIIAILAVVGYIVIHSVIEKTLVLQGFEIILLATALLFFGLGLYKRWFENDGMEEILGPSVEQHDGPDINGLKL